MFFSHLFLNHLDHLRHDAPYPWILQSVLPKSKKVSYLIHRLYSDFMTMSFITKWSKTTCCICLLYLFRPSLFCNITTFSILPVFHDIDFCEGHPARRLVQCLLMWVCLVFPAEEILTCPLGRNPTDMILTSLSVPHQGARAGHEPATSNVHCDHGVTVVSTRKLPFYPV